MTETFLICGFPRSRTKWFSEFLSINGYSHCTHEACEFAGSAGEFWSNAEAFGCGVEAYGNSDSANLFVLPALLAERPMTKVVWIERPVVEVVRSMKNAGMPYDERALRTLLHLRDRYVEYYDLIIDFHQLSAAEVCKRVWDLCLPGIKFDYGRWGTYTDRRICYTREQPEPKKDYEKFLSWVKQELYDANSVVES